MRRILANVVKAGLKTVITPTICLPKIKSEANNDTDKDAVGLAVVGARARASGH